MAKYELPDVWQWEEENSNEAPIVQQPVNVSNKNYQSERRHSNSIHWERRMVLK